ncbi:hypothetical protein GF358_03475 [Candidatus Woesearchaeota archaeon]|nr:hypothetical protein [Candidatus Woesearchaeota archaeon]
MNKKIIIGIIAIILISIAVIAEDKKYLEDLKKGDSINIGGETYSIIEEPKINTYTGTIEIKLNNGATIKGRTRTELIDIAEKPENYAEYIPPEEPTETPTTKKTTPEQPIQAGDWVVDYPELEGKVVFRQKSDGTWYSPSHPNSFKQDLTEEQVKKFARTYGTGQPIKESEIPKVSTKETSAKTPKTETKTEKPSTTKSPKQTPETENNDFIGKPGWRDYMHWKYHTEEGENHPEVGYEQWAQRERTRAYEEWEEGTKQEPMTASRIMAGISQFLAKYEQYRGFARFGSLFFTGETWERHREKVNQAFCDTILLGGTKCWTSRICDTQLYPLMPRGTFSGRTPSGQRQATASIQAEKSLPIAAIDNGQQINKYLYKITYSITNPYEEQELKYNIQFRTADGYKFNWFPDYQSTPAYRTEASPLIRYGKQDYTEVCLIFHPYIVDYHTWHGRNIREWCTKIIQYTGTATKPYPTASNETDATPTPDAPEELPEEGEVDRFEGF